MRKPVPTKAIEPKIQTRLNALERLIDSKYEGMPSVFEAKTGVKMAQLNQWFSGYRPLRDKALKTLIEKTGVDEDYFDTPTLSPEEAEMHAQVLQLAAQLRMLPAKERKVAFLEASSILVAHQTAFLRSRELERDQPAPETKQ